jgi:hypothetical protein
MKLCYKPPTYDINHPRHVDYGSLEIYNNKRYRLKTKQEAFATAKSFSPLTSIRDNWKDCRYISKSIAL